MPRFSTRHIAVTAGMVAAVGAFGAGAYALSQGGSSFDPSAFISAYDRGGQDRQKGYQANRTKTDAQANRADDGDDRDTGADADNATDTPAVSQANVPAAGASGTTAVRVTGDGSGTGVNVAGGSGSGTGGTVVSGPVIPGSGGTGTPGTGGNSNNGGGNGGAGGNGGQGGNNQGGAATDPTQNSYRVLPQDPVADEKKLTGFADDTVNSSNEAISKLDETDVEVMISGRTAESNDSDNDLYVGQKLDAWTVFLALDASYHPKDEFKFYQWACKKDDFASYPYFKVLEFPSVVPDKTFDIKVAYRINDRDSWHELTVPYLPAQTCTFIVGSNAECGQQVIKSYKNPVNLYPQMQQLMSQLGYCEVDGSNLTHLLLGWKEGETEVSGPLYAPEPGRHVLEPSKIVKIPDGCSASIDSEYVGGDLGTVSYQTLSGVESDSAAISMSAGGRRTLTVPEGFQKVDFDEDCEVDDLSIPSSVLSVDAAGSKLKVKRVYKVDKDNALYATTADGVLTDKAGTEYYGIPTGMKKLVVPVGVTSVQIPEGSALKTVVIEPNADGSLPAIGDLANLHGCNFVVDDACAKRFIAQHVDALGASTGNTVTVSSLPGEKMSVDQGVVSSGSTVWTVSDTGSSWVEVGDLGSGGMTTFRARCFEDDPSAFTLVLSGAGGYAFDDGCFDNSSIETIVCATQAQLDDVNRRLAEMGRADDITTTLIETTDDGYVYYHVPADGYGRMDADGNIVALLKAPSTIQSFDGTFVDTHGDTVKPELIASWAFKGCDQLEWVETSDETWYIGAEAFKGCSAIQGMFLGYADTLNVEPNAFADCPRMKFLAARSMDGEFADECEPNASCAMYAPTGAEGYCQRFTSFTVESNVVDYSLVHQSGDNGFILCGNGAAGNAWLVLRPAPSSTARSSCRRTPSRSSAAPSPTFMASSPSTGTTSTSCNGSTRDVSTRRASRATSIWETAGRALSTWRTTRSNTATTSRASRATRSPSTWARTRLASASRSSASSSRRAGTIPSAARSPRLRSTSARSSRRSSSPTRIRPNCCFRRRAFPIRSTVGSRPTTMPRASASRCPRAPRRTTSGRGAISSRAIRATTISTRPCARTSSTRHSRRRATPRPRPRCPSACCRSRTACARCSACPASTGRRFSRQPRTAGSRSTPTLA